MKINYPKILKSNMLNVLKDVLIEIETNGLNAGHHLYITFQTKNKEINIPDWLKKKFPKEMTIVIQHEYWNLKVYKKKFEISLSFNNIHSDLSIPYSSVISFADPYANFGLGFSVTKNKNKINNEGKIKKEKYNNIINFSKFKKN